MRRSLAGPPVGGGQFGSVMLSTSNFAPLLGCQFEDVIVEALLSRIFEHLTLQVQQLCHSSVLFCCAICAAMLWAGLVVSCPSMLICARPVLAQTCALNDWQAVKQGPVMCSEQRHALMCQQQLVCRTCWSAQRG